MRELTAERLREMLHYDPQTGVFTWVAPITPAAKVGQIAGSLDRSHGYRKIHVDGGSYYEHRLVWLYVHGRWPSAQMDHINMDRSDNRLSNLREATNGQNTMNRRVRSDSVSKIRGVRLHKRTGKWMAKITVNGEHIHLGYFDTAEMAGAAYEVAARELHGKFTRAA